MPRIHVIVAVEHDTLNTKTVGLFTSYVEALSWLRRDTDHLNHKYLIIDQLCNGMNCKTWKETLYVSENNAWKRVNSRPPDIPPDKRMVINYQYAYYIFVTRPFAR